MAIPSFFFDYQLNLVLKSLYLFFSNRDNFQATYLSIYSSVHQSQVKGFLSPHAPPDSLKD